FSQIPPPACFPLFPCTPLFRSRRPPPQSRMGLLHISPSQSISLCCHVYDTRPWREILARRAAHFAPAGSGGELPPDPPPSPAARSEEHTSELQSRENLVCRLLL